ncbi:MAG: hypothetical protein HOK84_13145, partial [Bacteroidetes bacterium]|nr:hypothetical protein [Bacteroidota bacterium]
MQKDYIYTLPSIIYICLACLSLILVLLIWRKRNTPGAKPTSLFFLALFIWAFAYIFESAATNVEGKLLWSQIAYLGTLSTPMLFLAFSQEYCNRRLIHKPYAWILLGIIPMATFILAWTNNSHHLVWTDITIQGNQHLAVYGHGIAFWVFFIYAYILIILSLGYLIFTAFRLHKIYRQQAISTSIAVSFVVAGNILYMIPSNPIPGMEWTLLGFLLCSLILSYNILGLKLFNLVPIARTHLVDTMTSGMLLVDKAGRIKDINQSFLSHLNIQNIDYLGQPYSEVLCNTPELIDMLSDKNVFENQKISEFHHHDQILDVRISDLASKNHKMTGRLLLINDITDLKQAEQSLQKTNKLLSDQIENSNKLILELDAYAHTVAHDLKIPLNSLVGFSELLTEELQSGNSELAGKYSTQITSSADKMVQIIEELLLLSSVRSQSVELQSLNIGKSVGLAQDRISELIKASKTVIKQP